MLVALSGSVACFNEAFSEGNAAEELQECFWLVKEMFRISQLCIAGDFSESTCTHSTSSAYRELLNTCTCLEMM